MPYPDDFSPRAFDAAWGHDASPADLLRDQGLRDLKVLYKLSAAGSVGVTAYLEVISAVQRFVHEQRVQGVHVDEKLHRRLEGRLYTSAGEWDRPRDLFDAVDEHLGEFVEAVIADNWPGETDYRRPVMRDFTQNTSTPFVVAGEARP